VTGRVLVQRARLVGGWVRPYQRFVPAEDVAPGLAAAVVDGALRLVHRPSGQPVDTVERCRPCMADLVVAAVGSGVDWTGSLASVVRDRRFRAFRAVVGDRLVCRCQDHPEKLCPCC
jgi:hypothetical protein